LTYTIRCLVQALSVEIRVPVNSFLAFLYSMDKADRWPPPPPPPPLEEGDGEGEVEVLVEGLALGARSGVPVATIDPFVPTATADFRSGRATEDSGMRTRSEDVCWHGSEAAQTNTFSQLVPVFEPSKTVPLSPTAYAPVSVATTPLRLSVVGELWTFHAVWGLLDASGALRTTPP
jgi:hypothetical protein